MLTFVLCWLGLNVLIVAVLYYRRRPGHDLYDYEPEDVPNVPNLR